MKASRFEFGDELIAQAKTHKDFVVCNPDTQSCGLEHFDEVNPNHAFMFGIAEQDLVDAAAGIASCGNKVYVSTFAVFLTMRACEQIRHFICYPNQDVTLLGCHTGLQIGQDGGTHTALEDVGIMRSMANMSIIQPGDGYAARAMARFSLDFHTPLYVRLHRSEVPAVYALANISVKQYLHLLVEAGYKYDTLEEIVAAKDPLKFAVGPRAGGNEVAFNRVLKAYGASFDDIESWGGSIQYISAQEGCDAVKDGQIDGNANLSAIPQSNLLELMTSRDMKWLSINETAGKELAETYGYTYEQLPANTYAGQTEAIDTIVDTVLLVVNGDLSDDIVFNLTKCLCENQQLWADGYEALSAFDPANAANTGIALHPGAEAYYKAAGLLK